VVNKDYLKILVLDDDPARHAAFAVQGAGHEMTHTWTVDEAIKALKRRRYDLVLLDNDLETEEWQREGYMVADFIALSLPESKRPRAVVIHSWNPPRAMRMLHTLGPFYENGNLLRREFGEFKLRGTGDHCKTADLKLWIEASNLTSVMKPLSGAGWSAGSRLAPASYAALLQMEEPGDADDDAQIDRLLDLSGNLQGSRVEWGD
jgi:CheY-like chemotaxis protein